MQFVVESRWDDVEELHELHSSTRMRGHTWCFSYSTLFSLQSADEMLARDKKWGILPWLRNTHAKIPRFHITVNTDKSGQALSLTWTLHRKLSRLGCCPALPHPTSLPECGTLPRLPLLMTVMITSTLGWIFPCATQALWEALAFPVVFKVWNSIMRYGSQVPFPG